MTATAEATSALRPEFIVVNAEFAQRYSPESGRGKWQAWLESAAGDYVEAFRYKNPLTGSALRFDGRFTDRVEDPYTNLDKANPEIVVYRRRR